jgi:hypothetical protein
MKTPSASHTITDPGNASIHSWDFIRGMEAGIVDPG